MKVSFKHLIVWAAMLMTSSTMTAAVMDTVTVRIKGMRCEECAHKVKNTLRQDAGIGGIQFNLERRTATIAFDGSKTCVDSIYSHLAATGRYKASPYEPTEMIRRGYGQRIDDMHCQKCVDRIIGRLSTMEGIDSLGPHLDKHYIFIRYDANRTCKADIRAVINKLGYTPVNYYSGDKISWLYANIPAEQANDETLETVLTLTGVEDVNTNARRKSLAVTFFTDETNADRLLQDIREAGINAVLPKPHVCSEEEEKK